MTNRVRNMQQSTNNASAVWMQYTLSKRKNPSAYYFFFEGYDRVYYLNKFKELYNKVREDKPLIQQFNCGGKAEVQKLYEKLNDNNENLAKKMFIIDKDYDDREQINEHIYQTDYYSLENYYTTIDVVKGIIEEEFGINSGSDDYEKIISDYLSLHNEFINKLTDYNILALTCKNCGIILELDVLSIFSCFEFKDDFTIKIIDAGIDEKELNNLGFDYLIKRYSMNISRKRDKLQKSKKAESVEILDSSFSMFNSNISMIRDLFNENKEKYSEKIQYYFRGKEDFKFLITFLKMVQQKTENVSCAINFKSKKEHEILSILSKHAIITENLKNYYKKKIESAFVN